MKPFHSLSRPARFRRLRAVACAALPAFGLPHARLQPLTCWENATWRIHGSSGDFLLRVHRAGYRSPAELEAELAWLATLHRHGLPVSRPCPTTSGAPWAEVEVPGVPGPRLCTVLHWQSGRIHRRPDLRKLHRLGRLFARLHQVATIERHLGPRPCFDDTGWFRSPLPTGVPAIEAALPPDLRDLLARSQAAISELFGRLDRSPSAWGPIHADLHFSNVVYRGDLAVPIDFDDMGTGPYLYDLAIPFIRCSRLPHPTAAWAALVAGYRTIRPLSESDLATIRDLAVLQMPGVIGYVARRWPDPQVVELLPRLLSDLREVDAAWRAGHPMPFAPAAP